MKALMIETIGDAPVFGEFAEPSPNEGEQVVQVLAAGVHPIVRALAAGRHYGGGPTEPFVPGIDGIVRIADGTKCYAGYPRAPFGMLSERTVLRANWQLPIPADAVASDAELAGTMNPLGGAWMALVHRGGFRSGESVMVLGATGASGRLAVQLAATSGARSVVAVGRNRDKLAVVADGLDVVQTVQLTGSRDGDETAMRSAFADGVDIVVDFLWGSVAEAGMAAMTRTGLEHVAPAVRWVQVGDLAGATAAVPAATLRSSGLRIIGSGRGFGRSLGDRSGDAGPAGPGRVRCGAGRHPVDLSVRGGAALGCGPGWSPACRRALIDNRCPAQRSKCRLTGRPSDPSR